MEDFNSFVGKNESKAEDQVPESLMSTVRRIAGNFKGKDESEVIAAIFKEAEKGRKNGTLSDKDLDAFYQTVSPFVDDKKRKKLREIVEKLKKS